MHIKNTLLHVLFATLTCFLLCHSKETQSLRGASTQDAVVYSYIKAQRSDMNEREFALNILYRATPGEENWLQQPPFLYLVPSAIYTVPVAVTESPYSTTPVFAFDLGGILYVNRGNLTVPNEFEIRNNASQHLIITRSSDQEILFSSETECDGFSIFPKGDETDTPNEPRVIDIQYMPDSNQTKIIFTPTPDILKRAIMQGRRNPSSDNSVNLLCTITYDHTSEQFVSAVESSPYKLQPLSIYAKIFGLEYIASLNMYVTGICQFVNMGTKSGWVVSVVIGSNEYTLAKNEKGVECPTSYDFHRTGPDQVGILLGYPEEETAYYLTFTPSTKKFAMQHKFTPNLGLRTIESFGSYVKIFGNNIFISSTGNVQKGYEAFVSIYNNVTNDFEIGIPNANVPLTPENILSTIPIPIDRSTVAWAHVNFEGQFGYTIQRSCAPGYQFREFITEDGRSIGTCTQCPEGQYKPASSPSFSSCKLCPSGTYNSKRAATDITDCNACQDKEHCPPGSNYESSKTTKFETITCADPDFISSDKVDVDGSFYMNCWIDVAIICGPIALFLFILANFPTCGNEKLNKFQDFLFEHYAKFKAFEVEDNDPRVQRIAIHIVSMLFMVVYFMIIVFYLKVYFSQNTLITVTTDSLKSFKEKDRMMEIDSPQFYVKLTYFGLDSDALCKPEFFIIRPIGFSLPEGKSYTVSTELKKQGGDISCELLIHFPAGTRQQGRSEVKVRHFSAQADNYVQYVKYEIATENYKQQFTCSENREVKSTDNLDEICKGPKMDSYVSNFIVPTEGNLLRGSTNVVISSVLNRVEKCVPRGNLIPFKFSLTNIDCDMCEASGKLFSIFDTRSEFKSSQYYYNSSIGYEVTFEFEKSQTYRNAAIEQLLDGGSLFLALIITGAGLKDILEIILLVIDFFVDNSVKPMVAYVHKQVEKKKKKQRKMSLMEDRLAFKQSLLDEEL